MRSTDNRYRGEQARFELAMRMIGHEARTGTIRHCTGLSEDRIRKLYATYFKHASLAQVRRHRGKSPRQITPFVANLERRLEAGAVAALLLASGLLHDAPLESRVEPLPLDIGARFCRAFETYRLIIPAPSLSFEWTWNLYRSLVLGEELALAVCGQCQALYLFDALALTQRDCPSCALQSPAICEPPTIWITAPKRSSSPLACRKASC